MKNIFALITILFLTSCNKNENNYEITGVVKDVPENTILYLVDIDNFSKTDSCQIKSGKFQFTGFVDYPREYRLNYTSLKEEEIGLNFWIENSKIEIEISDKSFSEFLVSGSTVQNQFKLYDSLISTIDGDIDKQYIISEKFINDHPDYIFSAYLLNNICRPSPLLKSFNIEGTSISKTKKLYNNLIPDIKTSHYGKAVSSFIKNYKNYKIGDTIQNFTLTDINGRDITLHNYNEDYMLLYFWHYGCNGVNQLHDIISKHKQEIEKKGIKIIGVSTDTNIDLWKNESQKMNIDWINLNDPTGKNGFIGTSFGLGGYFSIYLIAPNGQLIGEGQNVFKKINQIK
jgi:peroxiredoxin